jgi:dihydroflavonol-4-reductase
MKHVLVTGASGHVGYMLTRLLVERGYRVRAGVRGVEDEAKTAPLRQLGVELHEIDLLRPETLLPATTGVDGVFQVAAVYRMWASDPQREIIDPSVIGGINMLRAACEAGVKKVVFTSSIAAVGYESPNGRPLTEADWTGFTRLPYIRAKTEAEQAAWVFAKEKGLNMVVVNPGTVLGPGFHRHTPSTSILDAILRHRYPAAPPFGTSFVDARDVARGHVLAYENDHAQGRYLLTNGPYVSMANLMEIVHEIVPSIKPSPGELPRWALQLGVLSDWLGHLFTGRPRELTGDFLREMMNRYVCFSHEKATRELGWEPMDFKTCVHDTIVWMREVM